jgi:two-component system CheB/CheR fusion protein
METVNEELRLRSEELAQVNDFLRSILTSLRMGVIVVDADFRIDAWNTKAEDMWGLRADEVKGKHLMNLDIGLPVEQLRHMIRASLSGDDRPSQIRLSATNRRGKTIEVNVSCGPLKGANDERQGVILIMQEAGG